MNKDNRKSILLIDDSLDIRELLTTVFESNGYRVDSTANGREALSLLENSANTPDLIVLDAQMPIMDGFRFRHLQNEDRRLRDIPVVVMTGNSEANLDERMAHPDAIVCKPFHLTSMMSCISSLMS